MPVFLAGRAGTGARPLPGKPLICDPEVGAAQIEDLRIGPTAQTLIERVDASNFGLGKLKVENIDVLGDPFRMEGFRNRDKAMLTMPAEHDLRWCLPVFPGQTEDRGMRKRVLRFAGARRFTHAAAEGRPALGENTETHVRCAQLLLNKER